MPNGRCRMHGGTAPAGIASPHFKHGKRSKYLAHLPAAFAPHFDPNESNVVALTEELALIEAGVVEVLERVKDKQRITSTIRKELWDLVERKARLVAVESRRRKDEHEMVSREQFGRFASALLASVASNVPDPRTRGKIQEDALRILAISNASTLPVVEAES
jgi:hypothetical protein